MANKNEKKLYWSIYLLIVLNCISILVYNYFLLTNNDSTKLEKLRRYVHAIVIIGTIIISLSILLLLYIFLDNTETSNKVDNIFIIFAILFLLFISASPLYINKLVKQGRKVNKPLIISYTIAISIIICIVTYSLTTLLKQ
jgi:hypothetical protein